MAAFLLPDLGEGLTEAEIVSWLVGVGDTVAVDQAVVEVETAKAVVAVPVPFAGQVAALHGEPGDVLAVGAPLITVTQAGASAAPGQPREDQPRGNHGQPVPAPGSAAAPALVPAGSPFAEPGVVSPDPADGADGGSGQVLVGYGTPGASPRRRSRRQHAPPAGPAGQGHTGQPVNGAAAGRGVNGAVPARSAPVAAGRAGHETGGAGRPAVVSPVVRRLARQAGLELAVLHGTGPGGLITRRDVDQAIAATAIPSARAAADGAAGAAGVQRIPIRGAHKVMADRLARSRREIPEATVWVDADATGLMALRASLNADESAPKISLLALVARFALLGLARYPRLNARIEGEEIVLSPAVHLGFAAQTPRGLVVPVLRDAQAATLEQLSAALAERIGRARDGALAPGELAGGTFTINNYGVFGVDGSAAIINHPEVAILGIGRFIARPWVVGGEVVPRQVTELTLAFDHRVCDGGEAGGFLRFVADCMQAPLTALRHL
jgi:pyruvate dehydrogenase E2 component (dihydrolipoamide acetyltransferase)